MTHLLFEEQLKAFISCAHLMISIGFPPPPSSLSSLSPQGKQGILYANDMLWSNKELLLSYGADSFDHSQPAVCSLSPHILAQL